MRDELCFVSRIVNGEVQVGLGRHVQNWHVNRTQRLLDVGTKPRRRANVVSFPRAHLQDQIIGVCAGNKIFVESVENGAEGSTRRSVDAPQFLPPPALGEQPTCPDRAEGLQALLGLLFVIATRESRVCFDRNDLALQPDDAMRPSLGCSGGNNNPIHKIGIGHRPLECLLSAHRKADNCAQMLHAERLAEQAMHRRDIVTDAGDREPRPVKRRERVAG